MDVRCETHKEPKLGWWLLIDDSFPVKCDKCASLAKFIRVDCSAESVLASESTA